MAQSRQSISSRLSSTKSQGRMGEPGPHTPAPPPIPRRIFQSNQAGMTNNYFPPRYSYPSQYNAGYGGIGGMYDSFNPMFGGSGNFGSYNNFNNINLMGRMAEEQVRPAFQSIMGVVQAFSSVSMMLESSFMAVYSSFQAVVGVGDHFIRMKNDISRLLGSMTVIRYLRRFIQKLLFLLGLVSRPPFSGAGETSAGLAGASVAASGDNLSGPRSKPVSSWPVIVFFTIIFGGPFLMWKLLQTMSRSTEEAEWAQGRGEHYIGRALYDFESATGNSNDELSFKAGDELFIAPKEFQSSSFGGWLLASIKKSGCRGPPYDSTTDNDSLHRRIGLVPGNYVKIIDRVQHSSPSTVSLPPPPPPASSLLLHQSPVNNLLQDEPTAAAAELFQARDSPPPFYTAPSSAQTDSASSTAVIGDRLLASSTNTRSSATAHTNGTSATGAVTDGGTSRTISRSDELVAGAGSVSSPGSQQSLTSTRHNNQEEVSSVDAPLPPLVPETDEINVAGNSS